MARPIDRHITRGSHGPAHKGDLEEFPLGQEFKIQRERRANGQDVQHALVVRDDDIVFPFLEMLFPCHFKLPDGAQGNDRPGPTDRVLVNDPPRPRVKEKG